MFAGRVSPDCFIVLKPYFWRHSFEVDYSIFFVYLRLLILFRVSVNLLSFLSGQDVSFLFVVRMITEERLRLVADIYDLPLQPERWGSVLGEVASNIGAAGGSLHVFEMQRNSHILDVVTPNYMEKSAFEPETKGEIPGSGVDVIGREYQESYVRGDEAVYRAAALCKDQQLRADFELIGIKEVDRVRAMPAIPWMRKSFGVDHRVACRLSLHGAWTDILAFQFAVGRGPVTRAENALAQLFVPHLARVVELNRTFQALKDRYNAILSVLDRLCLGVCLLSSRGDVVLANSEARRISELGDGFFIRDGSVSCSVLNGGVSGVLPRILEAASRTAAGKSNQAPRSFTIPRSSGDDPFLIEIMPLRGEGRELDRGFAGALMLIVDPMRADVISTEGMASIYQLTGAESEVCRMIAEGMETDDVADMRNTSPETVRTHIKHIFDKTGTKNRVQLVRLAHRVNLPLR